MNAQKVKDAFDAFDKSISYSADFHMNILRWSRKQVELYGALSDAIRGDNYAPAKDEELDTFMSVVNRSNEIVDKVTDDELVYDMVFNLYQKHRRNPFINGLEWCDPDTSYKEDVAAYMKALNDRAESLKGLAKEQI